MDPGLAAAIIGAGVAVLGGVGKWIQSLYKIIKTKDETISELRSQRDLLKISSEIQEKFFTELRPRIERRPGDPI